MTEDVRAFYEWYHANEDQLGPYAIEHLRKVWMAAWGAAEAARNERPSDD